MSDVVVKEGKIRVAMIHFGLIGQSDLKSLMPEEMMASFRECMVTTAKDYEKYVPAASLKP